MSYALSEVFDHRSPIMIKIIKIRTFNLISCNVYLFSIITNDNINNSAHIDR